MLKMKSLRESLLDDDLIIKTDKIIKDEIKAFLKANYKGSIKISRKPNMDGKYEVSSTKDIDVISKKITYSNTSSVKVKGNTEITPDTEVIIRSLKQPTCSKVEIVDGNITFHIDKELGIEIIGDTKAKILVEDEEESWDLINDDIEEEIDKEVNENYIDK